MNTEYDKIELLVKGDDGDIARMLEFIRANAAPGHSFEIVVDPDLREYKRSFYADGDGSFHIKHVKKNGKLVKLDKDGKLLENYLRSL